jgi:hypothetical protein
MRATRGINDEMNSPAIASSATTGLFTTSGV